jgi:hypothetical protein
MTLSEKETKIILIKYIIHGVSPYSDAPFSTRVKMLKAAVEKLGMIYHETELLEIGQECLDLQARLNNTLMGIITHDKDLIIKAHQELHKGNDSMRKELGENLADESLKVLKKKKWYDKF